MSETAGHAHATARLSPPQAWVAALRLRTLSASVGPVAAALALAWDRGVFEPLVGAATLGAAVLIQLGVNLANDYFDHLKGVDTAERLGPPRVTGTQLAPQRVRDAMVLTLLLAAGLGVFLVLRGGVPILLVGLASLVCAVAYAGGPRPLGHLGLGDVFVFVFFGPLATACAFYLQAGTWPLEAALVGVPSGALGAAILVVNNVRDIATDARAGKHTLAVRMGARASWAEYGLMLALAYAAPLALWGLGLGWPVLLPLASLPLALMVWRACVQHPGGPGLNRLLLRTAGLHALFALLLALGVAL
jgi:1,4-dihydroxy-2-naphthoate octaprenyltransferase